MQCFQCGTAIIQGSQFCSSCGNSARQGQKNKTNLYIVVGILGGLFLMCFGCGIVGVIQEQTNPQKNSIDKNFSPVVEKTIESNTNKSSITEPDVNIVNLANKSVEETEKTKPAKNTENKNPSPTPRTLKSSSSSNGYIRGPRGGCYYITSGGNKKYVDRNLCN